MTNQPDCATCDNASFTSDCTVDAVIARSPVAGAVLNTFGIDTCCGGSASLGEAAVRAHVEAPVLLDAIGAAQRSYDAAPARVLPQAPSCGCGHR